MNRKDILLVLATSGLFMAGWNIIDTNKTKRDAEIADIENRIVDRIVNIEKALAYQKGFILPLSRLITHLIESHDTDINTLVSGKEEGVIPEFVRYPVAFCEGVKRFGVTYSLCDQMNTVEPWNPPPALRDQPILPAMLRDRAIPAMLLDRAIPAGLLEKQQNIDSPGWWGNPIKEP